MRSSKCCKCEKDGPVILGQGSYCDSYCEEHAHAITERKKYLLWQHHVYKVRHLDWELEQAIAAAEGK